MEDKRLREMKENYNKVEVPEELLDLMKKRMEDARMEKKKNRIGVVFRNMGIGVAAALLVVTVLANSGESIAYAMGKIPILGAITRVVTIRDYKHSDERHEANIAVPKVEKETGSESGKNNAVDEVNKKIEDYTNELIRKYEEDMKNAGYESVDTTYEVITDNDRLFTLAINTVVAMGSSESTTTYYHIDKVNDRIIELKDLFNSDDYVQAISEDIKRQMREQMKEDEGKIYSIDNEDMPEDNFESIKENQQFYINSANHLVICFNEYEVAPGYMGEPQFEIATDVLQGLLADNTFIQ